MLAHRGCHADLALLGLGSVSTARNTLDQAKTAAAAHKLVEDYNGLVAAVPGLPQSRCTLVPGSGGLIPHHWCLAAVGPCMVKAVARQLDTAHQLIAAQYRILNP